MHIKSFLLRIVRKMTGPFVRVYREAGTKHISMETEELFIQQRSPKINREFNAGGGITDFNRLDVIVRYLAVECYYKMNDYGLELYRKMQEARIGQGYGDTAVKRFMELIKSYQLYGYDDSSEIELDENLMLIDGSHRLALVLFYHKRTAPCKVRPYRTDIYYGIAWFVEHGFSMSEIQLISDKCNEILNSCFQPLSCVLWPPVYQYFNEITDKLDLLYGVGNIQDYPLTNETWKRAVEGIYSIDDIEKWKIEKKIDGMQPYPKVIRVMQLNVRNPRFRLKSVNNKTISAEGERLKAMIRNAYKDKVEGYFHDIIIHTGDNYKQSRFILTLLKPHFSLRRYFDVIREYPYVVIKKESEYLPDDFPDTYPFGKDIDIICRKNYRRRMVDDTIAFAMKECPSYCSVRHIINGSKDQIRIEQENFLVFQFDIAVGLAGMEESFVEAAVSNRKKIENYYVPQLGDEMVFRAYEYIMHPEKTRHMDYMKEHSAYWDVRRVVCAMPELEQEIGRIQDLLTADHMADGKDTNG